MKKKIIVYRNGRFEVVDNVMEKSVIIDKIKSYRAYHNKHAPGALIKDPIVNGVGGSWIHIGV